MFKSQVLAHYGTLTKAAEAAEITIQAISQWPDEQPIPEGSAYKFESLTHGALKVDKSIYRKARRPSKRPGVAARSNLRQ